MAMSLVTETAYYKELDGERHSNLLDDFITVLFMNLFLSSALPAPRQSQGVELREGCGHEPEG